MQVLILRVILIPGHFRTAERLFQNTAYYITLQYRVDIAIAVSKIA